MPDWNAIVKEFGPLVWRTAFRLLGNEADAADCYQQAFVDAVEHPGPVRNWPGFLRRIATTRALDRLRERYRSPEPLSAEEPPDKSGGPIKHATATELAQKLWKALAEIDRQQAEVFCLVNLEGLSNREAADQLRLTPNHTGVLLHRARAVLRERLQSFDPNREYVPGDRS